MHPQKNQIYEITVRDLNNLGYGVGEIAGCVTFVHGAVDGDTVAARVIKVTRGYAVARVERILSRSPHRIKDSSCTSPGCGGCAYRAVSYAHECELKHRYVAGAFRKAGLGELTIAPLTSTGETEGYRNKAQYPVTRDADGNVRIGFFAPKSHRVVEARHCPLQPAVFGEILEVIAAWAEREGVSHYDEESGEGLLRHVYLRCADKAREIMVTLVANGREIPEGDALIGELTRGFPVISGILLNVNCDKTNVICGEETLLLWGKGSLTDTLAGVSLSLAPAAFYQVNHDAAELLYARARELAALSGDELLLDLFSGVGSIGLSMARDVRELVGVEIVPDAVACAKENARANGIENARFYLGDANDAGGILAAAERERGETISPDVVILDPPRKGVARELLDYLAARGIPRIVYISCNPDTLARDAAILTTLGYTAGAVYPFDLFPRTGHVECVCAFERG